MVFESHTESVSRVQQIWKYVPQRLYERFPDAHFFLIVDDDVYIHHALLLDFVHHRDPEALVLYGPGFCDWGVKAELKAQISEALGIPMPSNPNPNPHTRTPEPEPEPEPSCSS